MALRAFLAALRENGRVRVPAPAPVPAEDLADALNLLVEIDRDARLEAPPGPPPLSVPAALWAALLLFRACQAFVFREMGEADVRKILSSPCPDPGTPSAAWSADLVLRCLPDLLSLANGIAPGDPLVASLLSLAREWPLSSVGVRGLGETAPGAAAEHPALLRIYADRIIEKKDSGRLADPRVREAVREALGAHPELCPDVARALEETPA